MEEDVKLNDGSEVKIRCKHLGGRKAFQLSSKILNINEFSGTQENPVFKGEFNLQRAPEICWDSIVSECPQRDEVCPEDMTRIYNKYAKDSIEFVLKQVLDPKS